MENVGLAVAAVFAVQVAVYLVLTRTPMRAFRGLAALMVPVAGLIVAFQILKPPQPAGQPGAVRNAPAAGAIAQDVEIVRTWSARLAAIEERHRSVVDGLKAEVARLRDQQQQVAGEHERVRGMLIAEAAREKDAHDKAAERLRIERTDRQRAEVANRELAASLRHAKVKLAQEQAELGKATSLLAQEQAALATTRSMLASATTATSTASLGEPAAVSARAATPGAGNTETHAPRPPGVVPQQGATTSAESAAGTRRPRQVAGIAVRSDPSPPTLRDDTAPAASRLSERPVDAVRPVSSAPAGPVPALREQLDAGLSTPAFTIARLPTDELIAGRIGSYYSIRLTNPATGKRFMFQSERYVLADKDSDLQNVFAALHSEIVESLPAGVEHAYYVRGYGSSRAFTKARSISASRSALNRIGFLPVSSNGRLASAPDEQILSGSFQHTNLPLLRAATVRDVVARAGGEPPLEIIAGELKPENDPDASSFALILWIKW